MEKCREKSEEFCLRFHARMEILRFGFASSRPISVDSGAGFHRAEESIELVVGAPCCWPAALGNLNSSVICDPGKRCVHFYFTLINFAQFLFTSYHVIPRRWLHPVFTFGFRWDDDRLSGFVCLSSHLPFSLFCFALRSFVISNQRRRRGRKAIIEIRLFYSAEANVLVIMLPHSTTTNNSLCFFALLPMVTCILWHFN